MASIQPCFFRHRGSALSPWIGPTFILSTAGDRVLGSGRWAAGPAFVGLLQSGTWVVGTLANKIWSFGANSDRAQANRLTLQPFANDNVDDGCYAMTSPVITADWNVRGEKWTGPVGGGVGRLARIGSQPGNFQAQAFYNVIWPDDAAERKVRFRVHLLFLR